MPLLFFILTAIGAVALLLWFYGTIAFVCNYFGWHRKRIYIAGKVGHLPRAEVLKKFAQAEREVRAMGFVPVSPVRLPHIHRRKPGDHGRESVRALTKCYGVYALEDYTNAPTARQEIELAKVLHMPVIYQTVHLRKLREGWMHKLENTTPESNPVLGACASCFFVIREADRNRFVSGYYVTCPQCNHAHRNGELRPILSAEHEETAHRFSEVWKNKSTTTA